MVVIELQLLTKRYVAIADNQKATLDARAEWPPHPSRLFSALVAALHDRDPCDSLEREVLMRLAQDAPEIEASNVAEDTPIPRRSVSKVYVPANDMDTLAPLNQLEGDLTKRRKRLERASGKRRSRPNQSLLAQAASSPISKDIAIELLGELTDRAALLDEWRGALPQRAEYRSERTFPSVAPDHDVIRFGWPKLHLDGVQRKSLAGLAERVTRFGHSTSLVRCALVDHIAPTLQPRESTGAADWILRVPFADQLERLESAFEIHRAVKPRVLPSRPQGYRVVASAAEAAPNPVRGLFSDRDWIILATEPRSGVQLTRCVDVAKALHGALIKQVPSSAFISGRDSNGKVSTDAHLALVPLPDVGHEHAHGAILGIALVMPHGTSASNKQSVLEALVGWELVQPGNGAPWLPLHLHGGTMMRARRQEAPELAGLLARTWCRPARRWLSVTPVALDRNPGNLSSRSVDNAHRAAEAAREIVRNACVRIGLPRPLAVELSLAPLVPGSAPVRAFEPFPPAQGRLQRVRLHVELLFGESVRGPVLLGAGRFFGLGLFQPVE